MNIDPFTTADRDAQSREIAWRQIDACKSRLQKLELLATWARELFKESKQLEQRSTSAMENAMASRAKATTCNAKHERSAERVQRLEIFITELTQSLGMRDE